MTLQHTYLSRLLETAVVAARLAGQKAVEEMAYTKTSIKNNSELVTQTDSRCQKIIIDRIKETYPDHGFLAEEGNEGKLFKQFPRGDEPIWWIIDPIDGTNNFAHSMPCFTVSIAAFYQGEPIVAAIFDPSTDSMYTAVKDGEAQLNGRKISAGSEKISRYASINFDSHFGPKVPKWAEQIMLRSRFRNFGTTALALAYVARAGLAAAIVPAPKLWDIAAGILIAQTADATITDLKGNSILPIDPDQYQGTPIPTLAANKAAHSEILEILKLE